MKKYILIALLSILMITCKDPNISNEKVWVYIEVENVTENDTTTIYRYGKIHQSDLDKIKSQTDLKGFFELTDARYIDEDDTVKDFSSSEESGEYFFRFKDVIYIEVQKYDPLKINIEQNNL